MTKYINAEKLKAEIGRLKENVRNMEEWQSLCEVLSFIDSLQQKQSTLPANLDEVQQSVVSIAEKDGQKGIRFCIGDVDMFIEAHDLDDGKEYKWPDATKRLKEVGKETFSHKQGLLMAAYCDEINAALREIGGDELKGYCWSSTEYNDYDAWYVNFSSGSIYSYLKFNSRSVRPVAAFKKLDIR